MAATFYHQLQTLLDDGLTVAVATIVNVKGSTPREVGAKMIIHPYGKHIGTVGGGCGEHEIVKHALDVLRTGEARLIHLDMSNDVAEEEGMVCGGRMKVWIEPFTAE